MPATYCLGTFARELSRLPVSREAWKEAIDSRPEVCQRDCTTNCRDACRAYANVQFRCAQQTARRGRK